MNETTTEISRPRRAMASKLGAAEPLSTSQLLDLYRWIYTSRRVDDMELKLKKQSRVYFQINGAGHEAVLASLGMIVRPGVDWLYCYYRDRALMLPLGYSPAEMLLDAVGAADSSSGGRQMPSHWSVPRVNVVTKSSCTGTQFLQSLGCAQAGRYMTHNPAITPDKIKYDPEEITIVTGGDGATSEGEFFEAVNAACLETPHGQLPMLFVIEDNDYAISVPKSQQTAGGSISKFLAGLSTEGLLEIVEVDGTDPVACYTTFRRVEKRLREERRPVLVHAHVIRPYSHSESDDDRTYKTPQMREEEQKRDPLVNFPRDLIERGVATDAQLESIRRDVDAQIEAAAVAAVAARRPEAAAVTQYVTSPTVDPTSDRFATAPQFENLELTMIQGINKVLFDEMARNPGIVIFGEDVADVGQDELLKDIPAVIKGKGGVFKATAGLQKQYGSLRVYNSQLAEATIVGAATGMATRGLKPVAEVQFSDYIWPAMMQLVNETAKIRWRSNNGFSCPAVIRVATGGYLGGSGAVYHSQSVEATFAHIPGLLIAYPSTALDAIGLLRTAIRCDDPVLFLEHKRLYRQPILKSQYPGAEFMIPFGRARIPRQGKGLTVVTYGATVLKSMAIADKLAAEGIDIEVIDLRTIVPWDQNTVAESVRKTSRVLVVHEDVRSVGFGAEIAAWIGENDRSWQGRGFPALFLITESRLGPAG
ncbi:MAG: dehydrogenase [candidate division Zixibacteria bacterium]|nr:dehydrogenase [candidate division Zixibacteria bacterium]